MTDHPSVSFQIVFGGNEDFIKIMMTFPWAMISANCVFIILWKTAGAFFNPICITVGPYSPELVLKSAFHSSPSCHNWAPIFLLLNFLSFLWLVMCSSCDHLYDYCPSDLLSKWHYCSVTHCPGNTHCSCDVYCSHYSIVLVYYKCHEPRYWSTTDQYNTTLLQQKQAQDASLGFPYWLRPGWTTGISCGHSLVQVLECGNKFNQAWKSCTTIRRSGDWITHEKWYDFQRN